jgi:DNA-binding CsgD family transcriptional regulator
MSCLDDVDVHALVQFEAALSDQTLEAFLDYVRRHFELANVVYVCPSFPGRTLADPFLAAADRDGWARRNIGYASFDPFLRAGARAVYPADWSHSPPASRNGRSRFGAAQAGGHGLSFPLRGPTEGHWAIFIAISDESHVEWHCRRQELKKELAVVANYVHRRAFELHGSDAPAEFDVITRREIESLEWIAEGRSLEDTAVAMRISATAVRAHLDSARHKLQAVNHAHAVTKAIRRGLIH